MDIETRYHFMDQLIDSAREAHLKGHPMVRPLFYNYPQDEDTFMIDDQYMLGRKIMVAPQIHESVRERDLYLPDGNWVSYPGNVEIEGKQWISSDLRIPVFVRRS
jgi:alpha-glucosidase